MKHVSKTSFQFKEDASKMGHKHLEGTGGWRQTLYHILHYNSCRQESALPIDTKVVIIDASN